ncbi:MAG: stage II sporulation protein P [Lachnospiraceae bacterium]|nr:stage II sporulation protein P [Lachnospiraceae bacterium]
MEKIKSLIEYLYCFIVIGISMFIIVKSSLLSEILLKNFRDELIPMCALSAHNGGELLYEVIPILTLNNEKYDDGYDLSYNDFDNYDYSKANTDILSDGSDDGSENDASENVYGDNDSTSAVSGNSTYNTNENITATSEQTTEENPYVDDSDLYVTATAGVNPEGIYYTMEQLRDYEFMLENCYAVDSSTNVLPEEIDPDTLLNMDMSIDLSGDDYKVLIYHTHGSEAFADSREGVTEDTVIGVGDELTRILEEDYGIKTYHDRNVYDMVDGVLDRSYAYTLSGDAVDRILAENPSIQVVIDLHRDGVREDLKLMRVIDGRPTAQIMFLNGVSRLNLNGDIDYLYNPNKIDNLAFSLQMHLAGKALYGDLLRRIYIRGYSFNLEKMPRASLVEVGAQTNTVEEAKNAMIPLARIIYTVLSPN